MRFLFLYLMLITIGFSQCVTNIGGECSNTIYKQIDNEKKIFKIIKFDRNCGATTSNSIQLSVLNFNDSLPNDGGNIFISDSKVGGYIERDTSVEVIWIDNNLILIKYDRDLRIFKNDTLVNNIKIMYQLK